MAVSTVNSPPEVAGSCSSSVAGGRLKGLMWHLRDLGYFVAVAAHGNFTRAAEELFVSQPTLSKQIAALERGLNTALFHRNPGGVRLTPAGEALLPYAQRMLALGTDAAAAVSAAATAATAAELTIGFWLAPGNGLLAEALADFAGTHPTVQVALRRADWSEPCAGVESGRAELALLWVPENHTVRGVGQSLLAREEMVLAMSARHPLAMRDELVPEDLRDEVLLGAPHDWQPATLAAPRVYRTGRATRAVRTIDETIASVEAGLGVIPLPPSLITAHMPPSIVSRPLRGLSRSDFVVVWRPEDERLPALRSLIECVVRASRGLLTGTVAAPDRSG
jgi:DNA-binding transcriptional LysR family regulator